MMFHQMGADTWVPKQVRYALIFGVFCLPVMMLCFFFFCFPEDEPEYVPRPRQPQ